MNFLSRHEAFTHNKRDMLLFVLKNNFLLISFSLKTTVKFIKWVNILHKISLHRTKRCLASKTRWEVSFASREKRCTIDGWVTNSLSFFLSAAAMIGEVTTTQPAIKTYPIVPSAPPHDYGAIGVTTVVTPVQNIIIVGNFKSCLMETFE